MNYAEPLHSREIVDAAGKAILDDPPWFYTPEWDTHQQNIAIVNNWRSAHQFPMNTFQVTLRSYALDVDAESLLAQRTKRLESIRIKLRRFDWLSLSQMQDLGGCRAVMGSVTDVRNLVDRYKRKSRIKHVLVDEDDYITAPKKSGYRGYHLIYAYNSDKKATYNGLQVELQIRTGRMHAWATAVETVDTFTRQGLKTGKGNEDWRQFFKLMSTYIALRDGTAAVPGTPTDSQTLIDELRVLADRLQVVNRLTAYGSTIEAHLGPDAPKDAKYYVLSLVTTNENKPSVTIFAYSREEVKDAEAKEQELIKATNADVVMVSVDSIASLHRAYPNYFLDTEIFLGLVREAIT